MSNESSLLGLKWQGGSKVFMLMPRGMVGRNGQMLTCELIGEQVSMKVNPALYPWLRPDVPVFVALTIVTAEVEQPDFEPPLINALKKAN